MSTVEKLAARAIDSKTGAFLEAVRTGWNNYSFIFYIGGISAILGALFGMAGWLSTILTVAFFFYAGKFKQHIDVEKERRRREKDRIERKNRKA